MIFYSYIINLFPSKYVLNLSLFGKVKVVGWVTIKSYNSDFDKLDSIFFGLEIILFLSYYNFIFKLDNYTLQKLEVRLPTKYLS